MNVIISPAKQMRGDPDGPAPASLPDFLPQAQRLLDHLKGLDYAALKRLLCCNDQIARLNYERYQAMDLGRGLTPALLAYEGIQYKYMAPKVFTAAEYEYLSVHLRILSGFYGLLRPFDGVVPYRLEMQAKLKTAFCDSLYSYWGGRLAERLAPEDGVVLDLASEEYSRAVRPHLDGDIRWIKAVFGQLVEGQVVEKGVYVKMARGEMVRFLAERSIERPGEITAFDRLGYRFAPRLSDATTYVFLQAPKTALRRGNR